IAGMQSADFPESAVFWGEGQFGRILPQEPDALANSLRSRPRPFIADLFSRSLLWTVSHLFPVIACFHGGGGACAIDSIPRRNTPAMFPEHLADGFSDSQPRPKTTVVLVCHGPSLARKSRPSC